MKKPGGIPAGLFFYSFSSQVECFFPLTAEINRAAASMPARFLVEKPLRFRV